MEIEVYKKIEAYIHNNMAPEEVLLFEKELTQNKLLQEELNLYIKLNHYLDNKDLDTEVPETTHVQNIKRILESEEINEVKKRLKNASDQYQKSNLSFRRSKKIRAIAAILLLLILGIAGSQVFGINKFDSLYQQFYISSDLPSLVNRSDSENNLTRAINLFHRKEYANALEKFKAHQKSSNHLDNTVLLYIGMCYLELDEIDEAIKVFDIVSNSNQLDNNKGLWFKCLAYLKIKDKRNTIITLERILESPSNFNFEEAQQLLNELD